MPSKMCVICERPFTWRKKWERCWDEVMTCSNRCNSQRRQLKHGCSESYEDGSIEHADGTPKSCRSEALQTALAKKEDVDAVKVEEESFEQVDGKVKSCRSEATQKACDTGKANIDLVKVDESLLLNKSAVKVEELLFLDKSELLSTIFNESCFVQSHEESHEKAAHVDDTRLQRKAACKEAKRIRRAIREGKAENQVGRKFCDLCSREVDLLVRCQIDESKLWRMVCGKCWKTDEVSGGVVDGTAATPHYRYGGLWKNLKKMPK